MSAKSLRLSASQSLLLIRILPFVIGDRVPRDDQKWKCFMLLSKILDLVVSQISLPNICAILQSTIEEHHKFFIAMYGSEAVIPKFHFLLHYPQQILNVGPMIRTWNMRNEAKLNIFKRASRLGNFKNIAFSVANRHQRLTCYEISAGRILDSPLECGPSDEPVYVESMSDHIHTALASLLPNLSYETKVIHPTWVKYSGKTIKTSAYIITGYDGLHPTFARVVDILVLIDIIILKVCIALWSILMTTIMHMCLITLLSSRMYASLTLRLIQFRRHIQKKAFITYI